MSACTVCVSVQCAWMSVACSVCVCVCMCSVCVQCACAVCVCVAVSVSICAVCVCSVCVCAALTCCSNLCLWSTGSVSSEKAFACSLPTCREEKGTGRIGEKRGEG